MKESSYPKVDLARWRVHVEAAVSAGQSLAAYAREHGLSRHTLYAARVLMRQQGDELGGASRARRSRRRQTATKSFIPVRVVPRLLVTAQLPNGVQLQCEVPDDEALQRILMRLAGLPCSG